MRFFAKSIIFNHMVKYSTQTQNLDYVFMALAHETRRGILVHLKEGEASAQDLAHPYSISLPAISKHLKILERANLVRRVVKGRQHLFTIEAKSFHNASDWVSSFETFWNEKLDNLESYLEKLEDKKRK